MQNNGEVVGGSHPGWMEHSLIMVVNPLDPIINFVGLVKLVPKVCSERLGWHIDKKGDLNSRILWQEVLTQREMVVLHQEWASRILCGSTGSYVAICFPII